MLTARLRMHPVSLRDCHRMPRFFFLIIPRPPISTLFPYTTLFRSNNDNLFFIHATQFPGDVAGHVDLRRQAGFSQQLLDRKSTRLNSSHVSISYAVFCLKKKNPRLLASINKVTPAYVRTILRRVLG